MILPEVRHDFLQLALARNGARDARGLKLGNDLPARIVLLLQLSHGRYVIGIHCGAVTSLALSDAALLL
jgi:uncharacterized membrane protein (UPF0127 family)